MSGPFDDFLIGCASDCVNATEPDRMLCELCSDVLPTDRMWKRLCLTCMDTEPIPPVEAK